MFNYGQEVRLARFQEVDYYNDPDFLNVDHFDLTMDEKRSHFAIWSSFSAPLIISANVTRLTPEEISCLTNEDIIAVDQDPLVQQATLVSQDETWDVLAKSLANGDRLLTIINKGNSTACHSVSFERIGLCPESMVMVKDLWTGNSSVAFGEVTATDIPSHGTAIMRISGAGRSLGQITPTGKIFNTWSLRALTAASNSSVQWTNTTGTDSQVWQTRDDATIRPLVDIKQCLTESGAGDITLSSCNKRRTGQQWDYMYSGNVRSMTSQKCLTESNGGKISAEDCLYLADSQVIALPAGVEVVKET